MLKVKRQKSPPRIVILGPQGSGKGTQAVRLAKRLDLPSISTGEMFRNHIKHRTRLGRTVARLLDVGRLVPDSITNQMLAQRLGQTDCRRGFILDGFPRTLRQARFLQRLVRPTVVLYLALSDRQAVRRLSGRRMAADGTIYHLTYNPPPKRLRGRLFIRDDDRPAAVRRRLLLFRQATAPILKLWKAQGAIEIVNAQLPILRVAAEILRALKRRGIKV